MAKRKKREEEEEEEEAFEFPEFDEEEYMKKQISKGKAAIITVAIAPLFSLASMEVFKFTLDWTFGFIVGIFGLIMLIPILGFIGIDTDKLGKKGYAMNWGMYFFTWLAVWIILINPPVNDFAEPTVNDFEVHVLMDGQWKPLEDVELNNTEEYDINVTAVVTDNVGIKHESISIELQGQGSTRKMNRTGDHTYEERFDNITATTQPYIFYVSAEDVNGHRNKIPIERTIGE